MSTVKLSTINGRRKAGESFGRGTRLVGYPRYTAHPSDLKRWGPLLQPVPRIPSGPWVIDTSHHRRPAPLPNGWSTGSPVNTAVVVLVIAGVIVIMLVPEAAPVAVPIFGRALGGG